MIIDLTRLRNNIENVTDFKLNKTFTKEELIGTEILEIPNIEVAGTVKKSSLDMFYLDLLISGDIILPSSLTLKPVTYPVNIKVEGDLLEMLQEIDENVKNIDNSIDIFPIIWENILMEIPMRVVNPDEESLNLEGNGWKVISEGESLPNEGLAKLKDLFK